MADEIAAAIIPVAGLGTRLAPITRAVPKAMLPLVGSDGSVRPVADWIAREAAAAGCERICFVTSVGQDELMRKYFAAEAELSGRVEYVTGVEPLGLGYAVWAARDVAAGGAVMVMLGDHIHLPAPGGPAPAAQVAEAFAAARPAAMVGVQAVDAGELHLVGVCRGAEPDGCVYRCMDLVEKPDAATAAARLTTPGLPDGRYLAHAGIYVFAAEIFDCLAPLVAARAEGAEVGLTEAQQALLARRGGEYFLCAVDGQTLDVGTPAGYAAAQAAMAAGGGPSGRDM